jgi:hypothetical protein
MAAGDEESLPLVWFKVGMHDDLVALWEAEAHASLPNRTSCSSRSLKALRA